MFRKEENKKEDALSPKSSNSRAIDIKTKMREIPDNLDIVALLHKGALLEYQVELSRQSLIKECEDFNTIDAFRILDKQGKG